MIHRLWIFGPRASAVYVVSNPDDSPLGGTSSNRHSGLPKNSMEKWCITLPLKW